MNEISEDLLALFPPFTAYYKFVLVLNPTQFGANHISRLKPHGKREPRCSLVR